MAPGSSKTKSLSTVQAHMLTAFKIAKDRCADRAVPGQLGAGHSCQRYHLRLTELPRTEAEARQHQTRGREMWGRLWADRRGMSLMYCARLPDGVESRTVDVWKVSGRLSNRVACQFLTSIET